MCEVSVTDGKSVLPWVALNAVSDTGSSTAVDLGGVSNEFTIHKTTTGSPTTSSVSLEGSLDGVNWYTLRTSSGSYPLTTEVWDFGEVSGGNTPIAWPKPHARYVRANLTAISGGTNPTVTVTIAVGRVI